MAQRALYPDADEAHAQRPLTRGECAGGPRPCPFVSCRHHLYLDVIREGEIKFNFPSLEVHELRESCALDVADRDGVSFDAVGDAMNLSCVRAQQLEEQALRRLKARPRTLRDYEPTGPLPGRFSFQPELDDTEE